MNNLIASKIMNLLRTKQQNPQFDIVEWNQNQPQLEYQLRKTLLEKACHNDQTYNQVLDAIESNKYDLINNLSSYTRIKKAFNQSTLDTYIIKLIVRLLDDYVTMYEIKKSKDLEDSEDSEDLESSLAYSAKKDFILLLTTFKNVSEGKSDFRPSLILPSIQNILEHATSDEIEFLMEICNSIDVQN